jgi:hypothetical protein
VAIERTLLAFDGVYTGDTEEREAKVMSQPEDFVRQQDDKQYQA